MTIRIEILGCGSSGGVPRIGDNWGACDPNEPKNRRLRCSILIERFSDQGRTTVLVDATPDCRQQLLNAKRGTVDAVLMTHDHADHTHGIDDLRVLAYNARSRVPVYMDAATRESLVGRFGYCFEMPKGGIYPPILTAETITPGEEFVVEGKGGPIRILPFDQQHGPMRSLGFRFGRAAYSSDISDVIDEYRNVLDGLDLWIVDALRDTPHPSHFSLTEALDWIEKVAPQRAVITHMHVDLDYQTVCRTAPAHVAPAYDGMVIEVVEE